LFEPIRFEQPDNPLELLRNVVETRETTVVVTIFNREKNKTQHGTRLLFDRGMNTRGTLDGPEWMPALKADVGRALAEKRSFFAAYQADETTQHAFIECCLPPPQLV
jgi:xanthine dehydrogenase accessory factor